MSRVGVFAAMVVVAVGAIAPAAVGVTVEWEQDESYIERDFATSDDGSVLYMATARDGIVVLDQSGSPVGSFPVSASRLDVAGDRLLVFGWDQELSVLDTAGNVITEVLWSGSHVVDVAISGSVAVLILRGDVTLHGVDRIELFDLDTLAPLGVLASPLGELSRHVSLGAAGNTLLVATTNFYYDENYIIRVLDTDVSRYEDLTLVSTVTPTDPFPGSFWSVVPGANREIFSLGNADLSLGVGNKRDWHSAATWYDENGIYVEMVWTTYRLVAGSIDVDGCFGLVGAMWEEEVDHQHGFKYVPDDRTPPCFVDTLDNIFNGAVIWLGSHRITKGCNPPLNDRFCPDDHVTRGQMAALLSRALGYTDGGGGWFTDTTGHLFETAIDKLATADVTKGCNPPTNTQFCPDEFVTRGQMAAFLVRALGYTDNGGGDLFIDDEGHVFEAAIDKLGTAGVTKGCNPPANTMFCPDDLVTRAQMAGFLKRALD
jgi:hypothetical protein